MKNILKFVKLTTFDPLVRMVLLMFMSIVLLVLEQEYGFNLGDIEGVLALIIFLHLPFAIKSLDK